ncbi:hypothetical protein V5O48_009423 [Marasmius crinis-equi]|uniref:Cytochrome P450 n=1 Tax=Marasmius crinis-equi TaxID=585013 RepID=A0ABR3FBB6_9AGAR
MPSPITVVTVALLAVGLVLSRYCYPLYQVIARTRQNMPLFNWTSRTKPVEHRTMKSIRTLLKPDTNIHTILLDRAIPNQRLVRAFELTNTFVSPEPAIRDEFRKGASRMLERANRRGWADYFEVALDATKASLPAANNTRPFDHFIQSTTLRVVLIVLLGVEQRAEELDEDDLQIVAQLISELWARSKTESSTDPEKLYHLNRHIRRLVPDDEAFPSPLDFVIPAWETMWRAVATTVAYTHDEQPYRETFGQLKAGNPTRSFTASASDSDGPSAQAIVSEVLRLHPPSRHIHRAVHRPFFGVPTFLDRFIHRTRLEAADIASFHRSKEVWGPSANDFDPARHGESVVEGRTILPFGYGPLQCMAKSWAPLAIGVMVSAILEVLGSEDTTSFTLVRGERIGGREGWQGWEVKRQEK